MKKMQSFITIITVLLFFPLLFAPTQLIKIQEHGRVYYERRPLKTCPVPEGDFNNDGFVNQIDLDILKLNCSGPYHKMFDLNHDQMIDQFDIQHLLPQVNDLMFSKRLMLRFKIINNHDEEECFLYKNGNVYRNFLDCKWNFIKDMETIRLLQDTLRENRLITTTFSTIKGSGPIFEIFYQTNGQSVNLRFSANYAPAELQNCVQEIQKHLSLGWRTRHWPFKPFEINPWMMHLSSSYQNYNGEPYFHHGIDMLVAQHSPIYLPFSGHITNIRNYIADNPLYWEVEVTELNGLRWQFHHVDQASIPQIIHQAFTDGSLVENGTYIGYTVSWPQADKYGYTDHHLHLNCLDEKGRYLNPLNFFKLLKDFISPEIIGAYYTPNEEDRILSENHLAGKVDIVVKIRDFIDGSPYELPVYKLCIEIFDQQTGKIVIPYTLLYHFDDLPGGANIYTDIYTIYKEKLKSDNLSLQTCGNYDCREFYYVVSNNLMASLKAQENYWDLNHLQDGNYIIAVYALDNVGNLTEYHFPVTVKKKKAYLRQ